MTFLKSTPEISEASRQNKVVTKEKHPGSGFLTFRFWGAAPSWPAWARILTRAQDFAAEQKFRGHFHQVLHLRETEMSKGGTSDQAPREVQRPGKSPESRGVCRHRTGLGACMGAFTEGGRRRREPWGVTVLTLFLCNDAKCQTRSNPC